MDHPDLTVSTFMGNSIGLKRVNFVVLQESRNSGSDASDQENEAPDVTMETDEPPAKKGKLAMKGKKGPKVRN